MTSDVLRIVDVVRSVRRVIDDGTDGVDPAPWFFPAVEAVRQEGGTDPDAYVRRRKIYERANIVLYRAMLTGSLRSWFRDGNDRCVVPGWAWEAREADWRAMILDTPFLHALLPDDWQRWTLADIVVEASDLDRWLRSDELFAIGNFPQLPPAYDSGNQPALITSKPLPSGPFVTLSAALSWLAFGISLNAETLHWAISSDAFGPDFVDSQRRLEVALEWLMTAATGGLPIVGKFARAGEEVDFALTDVIQPVRFHDFRMFDVMRDGLRKGCGLRLVKREAATLELILPLVRDEYLAVKVVRQALLDARQVAVSAQEHSADRGTKAPPGRRGRTKGSGSFAPDDAPLLAEMQRLIALREAPSVHRAAQMVAVRAKGAGTLESKADRLAKAYRSLERIRAK